MAEFEVMCPHCKSMLNADADLIGESVQCPECQKNFVVRHNKTNSAPELYSPGTAGILGLIFTPVFTAGCLWANYKALKDSEESSKALYFFILNIAILFFHAYIQWTCTALFKQKEITAFPTLIDAIFWLLWWKWNYTETSKLLQYLKEQKIVYKKRSLTTPVLITIAFICLFITLTVLAVLKIKGLSF